MMINRIWLVTVIFISLVSIVFNLRFSLQVQDFGTVDVQKLIHNEAQKLAAIYPNGEVPQKKLQELRDNIRAKIQNAAQKKHMILLSKSAALSLDMPDCTDFIMKALEDGVRE